MSNEHCSQCELIHDVNSHHDGTPYWQQGADWLVKRSSPLKGSDYKIEIGTYLANEAGDRPCIQRDSPLVFYRKLSSKSASGLDHFQRTLNDFHRGDSFTQIAGWLTIESHNRITQSNLYSAGTHRRMLTGCLSWCPVRISQ